MENLRHIEESRDLRNTTRNKLMCSLIYELGLSKKK